MATRTYLFTEAETDQFKRLVALGFTRQDYFEGTDEPQIGFLQASVEFTFFPEPYVDGLGKADHWRVEVRGQSAGGFACITTDAWLTLAEFDVLIDPAAWVDMLSTLTQLQALEDWELIMRPQLTAARPTQSNPMALPAG